MWRVVHLLVVAVFANDFGNLRFFNDSCLPESLEQADKCVSGCENDFLSCWLTCDNNPDCIRHCSSDQEDCLVGCPCHLLCPEGCPCQSYECENCEATHQDEIQECHNGCKRDAQQCMDNCPVYDNECQLACVDNEYTECIPNCPCYSEMTGESPTPLPETTSTGETTISTTTASTTTLPTTTVPVLDSDTVMFDVSTTWLKNNGFAVYLDASAKENKFGNRKFPPSGAADIFIGCGLASDIDTVVQVGAIMTEDELFGSRKNYPTNEVIEGVSVKNFFTYYSSGSREPFGFAADSIYLAFWDKHDCKQDTASCKLSSSLDPHRLSVLEQGAGIGLYRCGEFTAVDNELEFGEKFRLVMYYRLP